MNIQVRDRGGDDLSPLIGYRVVDKADKQLTHGLPSVPFPFRHSAGKTHAS